LRNLNELHAEPNLKDFQHRRNTIYNHVMDNANYKWVTSRTGKKRKIYYTDWWYIACRMCKKTIWAARKKDNVCPACQELKTKET
jgi:rubrerythrin